MNLRLLIYLNPSNIGKTSHKFEMDGDSGFNLVKNSIISLNKITNWHFYILVPSTDVWNDKPNNVTLIEYPYINDALNSRFHFDSNAINNYFNVYRHDIDLIWSMLPEHVGALKGIANKRREQIPIFTYINWMDYKENKGYEPSYKLRMLEGMMDADSIGIQSEHMKKTMIELLKGYSIPTEKIHIISPKTEFRNDEIVVGNVIGFPHRISVESNFKEMLNLIKDNLQYDMWVSNINKNIPIQHPKVKYEYIPTQDEYFEKMKSLRFGVSYHIGYSMWSMSVLDMMGCGKVVLAPNKNAFPEMFPENYPFLFDDKNEFIEKFNLLQNIDDSELLYWGALNRKQVEEKFTWDIQGRQLKEMFLNLLTKSPTKKTKSVYNKIVEYNAISKSDLINKNITEFGRRCSRAWNKSRIELMRDWGIKDDVTSEYSIYYYDEDRYKKNGIESIPKKILTPYEIRLNLNKGIENDNEDNE